MKAQSLVLALLAPLLAALVLGSGRAGQEPLSENTDAGIVVDREGLAARRPVLADRWGPADARTRVAIGDWLKTGSRGANALAVELAGGSELLLGPGTLVEVMSGTRIDLQRGELRATATEAAPLEVTGPGDSTYRLTQRAVLRARDGKLVRLDEDPRWLSGYEGNASTEALGSLLANVDGRELPLTIGYHKVTVDIRDQIARTVVEESFLNHTSSVLEGVFYFPLPAGASISGFGMWIDGELVQGDIVEKQRAREIYETILREKRDPGLLEWTGGNIFKARVYPIGTEKRIRIAYTQVLAKEGDTYAYHYALDSEMLRQTPLSKLQIEVNVASAEALEGVSSPSHTCRIRAGEHAARVEFDAEEYSPDRDFELRVRTKKAGFRVTSVPHRRGDDGYFMLLLDTPEGDGPAPDSGPLDVLVLADTSGSMWGSARANQIACIEALVGALSERDTLNLMTCDSDARFAFPRPRRADEAAREETLAFLEAREPLGWSDLDGAFEAAFAAAGPRTQVVYVGDGQNTSGDADPVALAQRLRRAWPGAGTFHAIVPGNRSERGVLRALAGLGGGSLRSIGGGSDPAQTAFELLHEIAAPAAKDLKLAFEGMAVAAVYPDVLPNLTLGGQQVVVGRFDPGLGASSGRVTVTGTLNGALLSFSTGVELGAGDGEEGTGNSFIPRMWARQHLDHLLDQGSSRETRERIIALSEDFQIITPFTSFLVLESDEDRERFQVERQFRMRDGEDFFAAGRESGRHELLRQQMLAAKTWRKQLRAGMLDRLAHMNRELTELLRRGTFQTTLSVGGGLGMYFDTTTVDLDGFSAQFERQAGSRDFGEGDKESDLGWEQEEEKLGEMDDGRRAPQEDSPFLAQDELGASEPMSPPASSRLARLESVSKSVAFDSNDSMGMSGPSRGKAYDRRYNYQPVDPFQHLFPSVGPPRGEDVASDWPEDVTRVLATLDRRRVLAASEAGWRIQNDVTYTDRRGRAFATSGVHLLGKEGWLVRGVHAAGTAYAVRWLADGVRGHADMTWNLGRVRPEKDGDAAAWYPPFSGYFGEEPRSYPGYTARLDDGPDGHVLVSLHALQTPENVLVFEIDPSRALLVEQRWVMDGKITSRTTYSAFQEVGGVWWPGEIRHWNLQQLDSSVHRVRVEALDADTLTTRIAAARPAAADTILLEEDEVELTDAKQAARANTAGLEDRWRLLRHFASTQRWDLAEPHLAALEALEAGKPGLGALRAVYLQQSRRGEELRMHLMRLAQDLAAQPRDAEVGVASSLLNYANGLNQGAELHALLEALEPVYTRQNGIFGVRLSWDQRMLQALSHLGRADEVFALQTRMVADYPLRVEVQAAYAQAIAQRVDVDAAMEFLATLARAGGPWSDYEAQQLARARAQILWNSYRLAEFVLLVEEWERSGPAYLDASLLNQYLSALVFLDREDDAFDLVEKWLVENCEADLEPLELARLQAAARLGLGQGYQLSYQRFEDERAQRMADAARALDAAGGDGHSVAHQIVTDWRFRRTDASRVLLDELYAELAAGVRELPAQRIDMLTGWLQGGNYTNDAGQAGWDAILDAVFARWLAVSADEDDPGRALLAQVILRYGGSERIVRHHRRVLELAEGEAQIGAAAHTLFHALLGGSWSAAVETELIGLLPRIRRPEPHHPVEVDAELDGRILALYDLVSWLPEARVAVELAALPDVNSLPRRKLAAKRSELLRGARIAAAERLAGLAGSLEPVELRSWAGIERAYLLVRSRTELGAARESAQAILTALVARHAVAETEAGIALRDRILAARCAGTIANLLARATDERRAQHEPAFQALLDAGIAPGDSVLIDWREMKYALAVALDRGDEVEALLAAWYAGGEEFAKMRWGRDYAHVLAERGGLEGAVETLLEVERLDELGHDDYRALADWYTALDRADASREARIRSYEVQGENTIGNNLSSEVHTYQRSGDDVPPELDPEIPLRFTALLRKATHPQNWSWVLQRYYAPTKDFALLACLPEAVLGHSAERIYPFLANVGTITEQIQEEATVDRLRAHLAALRASRARTDVDRRALALLEFMTVQRAGRQAHGTGDHAEIALGALREAFTGDWSDGEPLLMAGFLADRGALEPTALGDEQLRQLRELHRIEQHPQDRLLIAAHLAGRLWGYGQKDAALRTLEGAIDAFRASLGGHLGARANDALVTLVGWLRESGAYAKAESVLLREVADDPSYDQNLWLELRLFEHYRDAVLARAEISLGKGTELYEAVRTKLASALDVRTNENHAHQLVSILCDLWTRAPGPLRQGAVPADATRFAFGDLPRVLSRYQYRGGQNMVGSVADCLATVRDAQVAVEFLAGRAENEPRWLRLASQDFWRQHGWRLGNLRRKAQRLPQVLEERVLAIVLTELREDLRSRQSYNRSMYDDRNSDFWKEKRPRFLQATLAFLEEEARTGAAVTYATNYLYHGLSAHDQAIAGLARAHRAGLLDIVGRTQLATFLQHRSRWSESLPVLVDLRGERPGDVNLRVMLMRGYHRTGQRAALVRELESATAHFRAGSAWVESNIVALAAGALDAELFADAAELYDEAIALHVKTAPNRGVGGGTLAYYYQGLAGARSGLGDTDGAVDAAAGAIVSWGSHDHQRRGALNSLEEILDDASDLDAYAVRLAGRVAETGLENPILRKALGRVYLNRKQPEKAADQLRQALAAAPNDLETYERLVAAYDALRRPQAATEVLLEWARVAGHDIELYTKLGARFAALELAADAERAYTNVIEMMPNESESHAALASVRQEQDRWDAAVPHWRHVIRVRTNEPAGYLGLAQALIHLKRWDAARAAAQDLIARDWPERFGDVHTSGRDLLRHIPR